MDHGDVRTYRILGLVGQGGFGKVYRARLETATGFVREVAVKLLNDEHPPTDVLERFRDEARILGLVRDRAIVAVEPPIRLSQRWAVVMEYVDGCPLSRLLRETGKLPADVALEVVGEVARVLDKVWTHPGPDGRPLHLVHRDLKPANIQVTAHGEVKVLDFGIARAEFDGREAHTSGYVLGTPGYIAPERFEAREGPEADVFSLGIILEGLVTGWSPNRGTRAELEGLPEGAARDALALARRMSAHDFAARPTAREVERQCAELAARHRTVGLRGWAEAVVPGLVAAFGTDALSGEVLAEAQPRTATLSGRLPWLAVAGGGLAGIGGLAAGLGIAALALVGVGVAVVAGRVGAAPGPVPALAEAAPAPAPDPPRPPPEPAPPAAAPEPVAPPPAEVRPTEPAPRVRPAPAGAAPAPPAPAGTAPAAPTFAILVGYAGVSGRVEVRLDGDVFTLPRRFQLPAGDHALEVLVDGAQADVETLSVGPERPTRYVWKGADRWERVR